MMQERRVGVDLLKVEALSKYSASAVVSDGNAAGNSFVWPVDDLEPRGQMGALNAKTCRDLSH